MTIDVQEHQLLDTDYINNSERNIVTPEKNIDQLGIERQCCDVICHRHLINYF